MYGKKYREIREGLGLTQPQLAKLLDVHTMTIWKRENDVHAISREHKLALWAVGIQKNYELEYRQ